MPLSTNEKNLLISVFRMSLAVSERRNDDAVNAYADILNEVTGSTSSSDYDDMPPLVSLAANLAVPAPPKPIDLVISELPSAIISDSFISQPYGMGNFVRAPPAFCGPPSAACDAPNASCNVSAIDNDGEDAVVEEYAGSLSDDSEDVDEEDDDDADTDADVDCCNGHIDDEEQEVVEAEDDADVDCCNGHIDDEGQEAVDQEAVKAEEAEEEEVEEVELELEPVRIKKVIYWKDSNSGDIYACLPDDEVGDKVGQYVDGKPVFD